MINGVLDPSSKLLKTINRFGITHFRMRNTISYETTNGKIGDTMEAAVSGRLTSMLSITDMTLISPSGRISTIWSNNTFTIRLPYI